MALAKLVHASLHVVDYNVIITGRRKEKLDTLRRELENMGAEVLDMEFDVRERASARKAVDFLKGKWANINVLINNAGLALGLDKEYEGSFEDWDTMIDTNIKGLLNMTRFVVPGMVERNERTHYKYRFGGRRCCLCKRKCVLCNKSSSESIVGRTAYRCGRK